MADHLPLIHQIEEALTENQSESLICRFHFDDSSRSDRLPENQLLFFFKPECFQFPDKKQQRQLMEMVFETFGRFNIRIDGAILLDGKRLEEFSIIDRHYGFINRLSRKASEMVSPEDLARIYDALGIADPEHYQVLGGHEFLKRYPEFDEKEENDFWLSKHSVKLRSGFYFQTYTVNGDKFIIINGFHPLQVRRYTHPLQRIVVLLLNTDTDWKVLKADLSGDTYPERARATSIRGELFKNHEKYGLPPVDISTNCVHLSAGPFEAIFEIDNFLKNVDDAHFDLYKTNVAVRMQERALSRDEVDRSLTNPTAEIEGKVVDLNTFTEEKNTNDAIALYCEYFRIKNSE
ncbi:MAG: hypothetical protein ACM3SY_17370 [Candidatus Omnitrophota bacterium]